MSLQKIKRVFFSRPDDLSADAEAAIRGRVAEWNAAAEARDVEAFLGMYAEDVLLLFEAIPDVRGAAAMRDTVEAMMQDPAYALEFSTQTIVAARSGELAYETGRYVLTMSGPDGEPLTTNGGYVVVWRKEPDGVWRCVVDAPVTDPPETSATG